MDLEDKLRHERIRGMKEGIEQGRQQGIEQGREVGLREGRSEGENHLIDLLQAMAAANADKDSVSRVLADAEYREQMYAKYDIKLGK